MTDSTAAQRYATAEHAAVEAIIQSIYNTDGWVTAEATSIADVVVAGLRERGFVVQREPRCECGWIGVANHMHDMRMGRANAD